MRTVTLDHLLALLAFAIVTCFTPGPNNVMLLASGLNFGFGRTIPHIIGVAVGFAIMVLLVGLGLAEAFERVPWLFRGLQAVGVGYLLWYAWSIASAGPIGDGRSSGRPLSLFEAALFQWVNPKGWMMALTATATYVIAGRARDSAMLIAIVFGLVGFSSATTWALFGTTLSRVLREPATVRAFNIVMALLLVASLWPIVADALK